MNNTEDFILWIMKRLCNSNNRIKISYKEIADLANISKTTAIYTIKKLEEKGLINKISKKKSGRGAVSEYRIHV